MRPFRIHSSTFGRAVLVAIAVQLSAPVVALAQSRAQRAEAFLSSYNELRRFNGAALVIDGGDVLIERGFGLADLEGNIESTEDTRFRIASLTKQFTAALILRLAEEGLVRVDGTVGEYISEYPTPNADRITLHHLLTHTSGLPSYTDVPGFMDTSATTPMTPAEILAVTWEQPLRFSPGSDFEYSNSGYVLLGWIAERVTGRPYAEILRELVLEPLGLEDTGYDEALVAPEGHAKGYTRTLVGYDDARPLDPSLPFSAGMLYSTIGDLSTWAHALFGWGDVASPFVHPSSLDRMLTADLEDYAYGVRVRTRDIGRETNVRVVEHSGGIFGFASILRVFPEHERLIVLLDNTSSDLGPIVEGLTNLLWGAEVVSPKASIAERLLPIIESAGVEPAISRYRNWQQTRPDEYDYAPSELMMLAVHYREIDPNVSIALLEAQAEDLPEAPFTRFALSELYEGTGDVARAIEHVETALTYQPGVPRLLARLTALGVEPDPLLRLPVVAVDSADLAGLTGEYRIDPTTTLTVALEDDELTASRTGEPAFRLLPQSSTAFLLHGSKLQFVFEVQDGAASGVSVVEAGQRVTFPRIDPPF